jgi:ankyrin repeat protein
MLLGRGANPNVRLAWKEIPFDRDDGEVKSPPNIAAGRDFISLVGATPFYLAAKNGDVEFMRLLVEFGADPLLTTVQHVTPLMAAAGLGTWTGETPGPLNGTSEAERLEAVKLAHSLGNGINAAADFGDTPIVGNPIKLFTSYPENLEQFPETALGDMRWSGSTALHGAVTTGQLSIVQYLRNSLGLCKHLIAVLAEVVSKPSGIVVMRAAAPAPPLCWDPVRPLNGPGDWLARVRWVPATPDRDLRRWLRPANGRLRVGAQAAADGWAIAIPQMLQQRLALVDRLLGVLRDGEAEPALHALLQRERSRLARQIEAASTRKRLHHALRTLKQSLYPPPCSSSESAGSTASDSTAPSTSTIWSASPGSNHESPTLSVPRKRCSPACSTARATR